MPDPDRPMSEDANSKAPTQRDRYSVSFMIGDKVCRILAGKRGDDGSVYLEIRMAGKPYIPIRIPYDIADKLGRFLLPPARREILEGDE